MQVFRSRGQRAVCLLWDVVIMLFQWVCRNTLSSFSHCKKIRKSREVRSEGGHCQKAPACTWRVPAAVLQWYHPLEACVVGPYRALQPSGTGHCTVLFLSKELTVADRHLEMGLGLLPLPLQGALAPLPGTWGLPAARKKKARRPGGSGSLGAQKTRTLSSKGCTR